MTSFEDRILDRCGGPVMPIDVDTAQRVWHLWRLAHGRRSYQPLLTQPQGNVKYAKDQRVVTYGVSLAPHRDGHVGTVCPFSTSACRGGCVSYSGKGGMASVQDARVLRTQFFDSHPEAFVTVLLHELLQARRKHGSALRVRLNTFSDLRWEILTPWLFERLGNVRFYDYTKWSLDQRPVPPNYFLTFSKSERNVQDDYYVPLFARRGVNAAIVFDTRRTEPLPTTWHGVPVIDGDASDDRTRDPRGVVVGLRAKGRMRGDTSGMVRTV